MAAERLLVTPTELSTWQRGALDALAEGTDAFDEDYAVRALGAAQGVLQTVLGYDPFIHKTTRWRFRWLRPVTAGQAMTTTGPIGYLPLEDELYTARGSGGPIVVVDSDPYRPAGEATGYYTLAIAPGALILETSEGDKLAPAADLYEGWRGSHHVLEASVSPEPYEAVLTDLEGLEELDVLPPEVPEELRSGLCEAAVYIARRGDRAGVRSETTDLGAQMTRTESLMPLNVTERNELVALLGTYAHRFRRRNAP